MNDDRWKTLMNSDQHLSKAEYLQGWHWCWNWDGLLVGPGMPELRACQCDTPEINKAKSRSDLLTTSSEVVEMLHKLREEPDWTADTWAAKVSDISRLMDDAAALIDKVAKERDKLYLELEQRKTSEPQK